LEWIESLENLDRKKEIWIELRVWSMRGFQ
jgi:hypothetical protein